ncbi:MAG: hypothetical protein KME47_07370 [Nodosilinea sp. WJT8-NPBG4]|jgi:hypothetical protein|nr:hypothetical protein [Nodosilinea sp. WJT8-NPBG4]
MQQQQQQQQQEEEKPPRLAVIARHTTRELAREALDKVQLRVVRHGLRKQRHQALWCVEKIDVRGKRDRAVGHRAARPFINVPDKPERNRERNEERRSKAETEGKRLRRSKNAATTKAAAAAAAATAAAEDDLVTYGKHLATHVVLYARGRPVPGARSGLHASHLCHNERCLRNGHLRVEPEALNQQRKGCVGCLVCTACDRTWRLCEHAPVRCLSVTTFVCCRAAAATAVPAAAARRRPRRRQQQWRAAFPRWKTVARP